MRTSRIGVASQVAIGGGLGTIVLIVIALLLGADPRQLLGTLTNTPPPAATQTSRPANQEDQELRKFVSVVLAKTEDVWQDVFRQNGKTYREPKLVLFTRRSRHHQTIPERQRWRIATIAGLTPGFSVFRFS